MNLRLSLMLMLHELQHVSGSFIIKNTKYYNNIFFVMLCYDGIYLCDRTLYKLYLKEINVLYEVTFL